MELLSMLLLLFCIALSVLGFLADHREGQEHRLYEQAYGLPDRHQAQDELTAPATFDETRRAMWVALMSKYLRTKRRGLKYWSLFRDRLRNRGRQLYHRMVLVYLALRYGPKSVEYQQTLTRLLHELAK